MKLLSAVIISWNEEKNIGHYLDSLNLVADEIILLDSFSNDNTVAIAAQEGAEVVQSTFSGYIEQKNKALKLARNEYVDSYCGFVVSRETAPLSFFFKSIKN